jgi:hypothetical protein
MGGDGYEASRPNRSAAARSCASTVSDANRIATVAKRRMGPGDDHQIVLPIHVLPVAERPQVNRTVDLDEEAVELRRDPAALPLGQRAVLQDDDAPAERRPPSGGAVVDGVPFSGW